MSIGEPLFLFFSFDYFANWTSWRETKGISTIGLCTSISYIRFSTSCTDELSLYDNSCWLITPTIQISALLKVILISGVEVLNPIVWYSLLIHIHNQLFISRNNNRRCYIFRNSLTLWACRKYNNAVMLGYSEYVCFWKSISVWSYLYSLLWLSVNAILWSTFPLFIPYS